MVRARPGHGPKADADVPPASTDWRGRPTPDGETPKRPETDRPKPAWRDKPTGDWRGKPPSDSRRAARVEAPAGVSRGRETGVERSATGEPGTEA